MHKKYEPHTHEKIVYIWLCCVNGKKIHIKYRLIFFVANSAVNNYYI